MSLFHHGDDKEKQEKEKYDEAQRRMEEARRQQQQHAPPAAPQISPPPNPAAVQPGPLGAGAGSTPSTSGHDGQTRVADEGFDSYTVRKGDTLSGIAQHFYGKASHWHEIFDANRGDISDPDRIREGQVLRIPKGSGRGGPSLA